MVDGASFFSERDMLRFVVSLFLFFSGATFGQKPIIQSIYTADPSARVFNDTLYLYPSHDRDSAKWWDMEDWHVFSSADLQNWTDHGVALSLKDVQWATKYAWAPDCNCKNGKYYFYYPTDQDFIGVAVGNSPTGPFADPLGKPLIDRQTPGVVNNRDLIDPCIFIDDDGLPYLFFGQNTVNVALLNEDMISLNGDVKWVQGVTYFFESAWVHKYNGRYYLSYSGNGKILYAMADQVLGPYEFKGEILGKVNSGTNHHSIIEYKGQWYLFYHTSDLALRKIPEGSPDRKYVQWRRSVCFQSLHYNADGTIQKVSHNKNEILAE